MGIFVNKGLPEDSDDLQDCGRTMMTHRMPEGEDAPEKGGCQITSLPGIYYEKVNLKV